MKVSTFSNSSNALFLVPSDFLARDFYRDINYLDNQVSTLFLKLK